MLETTITLLCRLCQPREAGKYASEAEQTQQFSPILQWECGQRVWLGDNMKYGTVSPHAERIRSTGARKRQRTWNLMYSWWGSEMKHNCEKSIIHTGLVIDFKEC